MWRGLSGPEISRGRGRRTILSQFQIVIISRPPYYKNEWGCLNADRPRVGYNRPGKSRRTFSMGDFQVEDWMDLADLEPDQIVVRDQGGRFDDELLLLHGPSFNASFTHKDNDHDHSQPTTNIEEQEDSILSALGCRSKKYDSDEEDFKVIDYSRMLDEQNVIDLFDLKMTNLCLSSEREIVEDSIQLSNHLKEESLPRQDLKEFLEQLLVLMEPNLSCRNMQSLLEKLSFLKHDLRMEKRQRTRNPKQKASKDNRDGIDL